MMPRRPWLLSIALLFAPALAAQERVTHLLRTENGTPVDQKMVYEVVTGLDPGAAISFDADLLKVRIHPTVERAALMEALASGGAGRFAPATVKSTAPPKAQTTAPDGFPVLVDTGDAVADEAAFAAAKAAWREAHPEAYARYMESLHVTTPGHGDPASDH